MQIVKLTEKSFREQMFFDFSWNIAAFLYFTAMPSCFYCYQFVSDLLFKKLDFQLEIAIFSPLL